MSYQYPRVATLPEWERVWAQDGMGDHKVVPADAIVIERGELPEVHVGDVTLSAGRGAAQQFAAPTSSSEFWRHTALSALAIERHLRAHPPVDEAQVEALATALDYHCDLTSTKADLVARRLVELGWSKPEPTP